MKISIREVVIALITVGFGLLGFQSSILGVSAEQEIQAPQLISVTSVTLRDCGDNEPIGILGQLVRYGQPIEGTIFFLSCNMKMGFGTQKATGAQIAYIRTPNSLVHFSINPTQFTLGVGINLPSLPPNPPGKPVIIFN